MRKKKKKIIIIIIIIIVIIIIIIVRGHFDSSQTFVLFDQFKPLIMSGAATTNAALRCRLAIKTSPSPTFTSSHRAYHGHHADYLHKLTRRLGYKFRKLKKELPKEVLSIIKDALKALQVATFPTAQDTLQDACAKAPSQHQQCFDFLAALAARPFVLGLPQHPADDLEEELGPASGEMVGATLLATNLSPQQAQEENEEPTLLATTVADDAEQEKIHETPTVARSLQGKNEEPTLLATKPVVWLATTTALGW